MNTKAEQVFNELVEKFKVEAHKAIEESVHSVQGDLLPFINEDTEANANHRALELVRKIMIGEFEFDGKYISVDGWAIGAIDDFNHNRLVDVLSSKAGDAAKDAKIANLERQINDIYKGSY